MYKIVSKSFNLLLKGLVQLKVILNFLYDPFSKWRHCLDSLMEK